MMMRLEEGGNWFARGRLNVRDLATQETKHREQLTHFLEDLERIRPVRHRSGCGGTRRPDESSLANL